jgi:CO/xanthine dehydrogenase Mo-binding subunit
MDGHLVLYKWANWRNMMRTSQVGFPLPRVEAAEKISGTAQYIDDLTFPGMLHGLTIRSQDARGRIKRIIFDQNFDWSGFTIVTAADIPGKNIVALISDDQPYLASQIINHPEEPVVLLAHEEKLRLLEARKRVTIEVIPENPSLSIDASRVEATSDRSIIQKEFLVENGDVDSVWSKAAKIIEGVYETGAQEHLYIEPNGVIATVSPDKSEVTVMGSLQCPFYVHKALKQLFALKDDQIRVIQTETGGGFGGKEEYPSVIAGHAALLAWKSGRPVKLIYDRAEDMAATTKRHPSKTTIRSAVDNNGKLLALDIDFTLDGGAYTTLSPVVLSRGTLHAAGAYECPNTRIRSRSLKTNTPPNGAFRGFGAPQSIFAIEQHMNAVARASGITDVEVRRRNFLKDGSVTATGQIINDHVDLNKLMDRALNLSDFTAKREQFAIHNRTSQIKKGIGLATFMHGAGFTGSGERTMASIAGVVGTREGKVRILASSTEIGQGAKTIFTQIACDALRLPPELVEVAIPDTKFVPNSGPTVASRTTMVVGKLVQNACEELITKLISAGFIEKKYAPLDFSHAVKAYSEKHGELKVLNQYQQPPHIAWDDKTYRGDAYGTFAWAVYVAEVSVDLLTYQTQVTDFVAVQEVGKVVNPILAAGQIEGGVAQGIGFALYEKVVYRDGRMVNNRMTNYIIPTASDYGPIRVEFYEAPYPYGPQGAKGIGELPLDGAAPAIAAAIENAIQKPVCQIPFLPENLMETLQ